VSDLVDLTKDIRAGMFKSTLNVSVDKSIQRLRKINDIQSRYYIRFMAIDKPGVLAKISGILGKFNISIASVTQKERHRAKVVPIVMLIHEAKEGNLEKAMAEIDRLSVIKEKAVVIRMEEI
jgi:homoserine dehydrogenase